MKHMKTIGKQSHYIIKIGEKYLIDRYTEMSFSGTLGSDIPALYYSPVALNLNHNLWLNDKVKVKREFPNGGNIIEEGIIVAKYSHLWDMEKPLGKRASDEKRTSNYIALVKHIHNNKQIQY